MIFCCPSISYEVVKQVLSMNVNVGSFWKNFSQFGYLKKWPTWSSAVYPAKDTDQKENHCLKSGFLKSRRGTQEGLSKVNRLSKHSSSMTSSAMNLPVPAVPHISMDNNDLRSTETDSCVIQVEPIRVIAATPVEDPWPSLGTTSDTRDHSMLLVHLDQELWGSRRSFSSSSSPNPAYRVRKTSTDNNNPTTNKGSHLVDSCEVTVKRSLRHAASHPSTRDSESSVNKRRLDWRNSHRNYRSTPSSTSSRETAHTVSYEARRALRDYLSSEHRSSSSRSNSTKKSYTDRIEDCTNHRRIHPKRGGSMREYISGPECSVQHSRCKSSSSRESPSTKRWRCHTVDCACASPSKGLEDALTIHRHSFPCGENREEHHCQVRSTSRQTLEDTLWRSESLDWPGFQSKNDVPETVPNSPPRITIRYNDPGSLESVNEESLVFCFEAGSKNEFRQRLEKTIHAQYRELWELRATLEERSDFSDIPSSPEPDCNKEIEMPVSHTTSLDSNLDLLTEELSPERNYHLKGESHFKSSHLLSPSSAAKRQSYRNTLGSRIRKCNMIPVVGPVSPNQNRAAAGQSSFDSIDTVETSASSTDASRIEHVTTSFESSATADTTTTDSTTGETVPTSTSGHRLLNSRGDSGYRSMEAAVIPTTSRLTIRFGHSLGATTTMTTTTTTATTMSLDHEDINDRIDCLRSSDDINECQCQNDVHDDKCERNKPIIFARCTRYGLAKSRSVASSSSKYGWRNRLLPLLSRDYSIDERTDALFREFSRCDPVYERNNSGRRDLRQSNFNKRWQQRQEQRLFSVQHDSPPTDSSDTLLHSSLQE